MHFNGEAVKPKGDICKGVLAPRPPEVGVIISNTDFRITNNEVNFDVRCSIFGVHYYLILSTNVRRVWAGGMDGQITA